LLSDALFIPRGFFISIEGLDGSGKTTQMNAVASHIRSRGYEVLETREPGGTPISEEIRRLVLDPTKTMCPAAEALLYAAARAEHVREFIRPAIMEGKVVLCDRYVDSSIVYQGAGRELGVDKVMAINAFAIDNLMPDLTLLFVVDAQTAFLRRSSATNLDRLERAGELFFQRVYDAYAKIAQDSGRVRCIDACRDIQTVTAEACASVDRLLASR
jgi:dTMP kinase